MRRAMDKERTFERRTSEFARESEQHPGDVA